MKKKINWKNEKRKLKDLKVWDENPRQANKKEEEDLKRSLDRFGLADPIIINTDNQIIGGHFRRHILEKHGEKEVDVRVPDRKLTKKEMMELNLRLNKNTGSWNIDQLLNLDTDLLMDVGFEETELGEYWDSLLEIEDDGFNIEKALEEAKEPITKEGELWQLGDHRLLVGDATKEEDVKRLAGEDKINMVYCDPPYNIKLDYSKGISTKGKYKGSKVEDNKKIEDYKAWLDTTIKNALKIVKKNAHIFYWGDQKLIWLLQQLYEENGIKPKRVCLWIKNNFNMTPQVAFNKVYEPCVYGTIGKPYLNKKMKNLNEVLNKEVGVGNNTIDDILDIIDIWLVKRDNAQEYEHPTQKPVTLNEKPMKRCTQAGDKVLDLFGGSGSTLIAAEQLKRKCYMMEIDPIFATVILNRYEKFTETKPKKIN